MNKVLLGFLFLLLVTTGWANEEGHHQAVMTDLIPPYVNFLILWSFLIWKLKNPLKKHFINKSNEVSTLFESAQTKFKEAQVMMETTEIKMKNIQTEAKNIVANAESEAEQLTQQVRKEIEERITDLKNAGNHRAEAEKNVMMRGLTEEFIEKIVANTKMIIKEKDSYRNNASQKLLDGIEVETP